MDQTSLDSQEFLSGVADSMDAKAAELEASNGAATHCTATNRYQQFGSKMIYTACYTLSYGVCFPVFLACRYIPKNNLVVNGLVDGGASANKAADEMVVKAQKWLVNRHNASEHAAVEGEVVDSGIEALASA